MKWTRTGAASGFDPAAVPNPGTKFAYATIDNKLYLLGGESGGSAMLHVQEYDLDTNAWTTLTDVPRSSSGLHEAAVVDGLIYYFDASGGFTSYDPSDGTAVALAAPPAGGSAQQTSLHAVGRNIYANLWSATPWRYNIDDDAWYTDVDAHPGSGGGDLYTYLSGGDDGLLYTFGQHDKSEYTYDPDTDSWAQIDVSFLRNHDSGGNAVWTPDGYWYAINGSTSAGGSPTTLAELLNPRAMLQTYALSSPPDARVDFAIAALGAYILLVGGTVGGVEEPDTYAGYRYVRRDTELWDEARASMPTPQRGTAYCVHEGELWVLGGLGTDTLAQSYDPATDTWTVRPSLSTGIDDDAMRAVSYGGLIYFDSYTTALATYDPSDGTVTSLTPEPYWGGLGAQDFSLVDGKIYWLLGLGTDAAVYDIATDAWSHVAETPVNMGSANQAIVDGKIYVLSKGDPELYFYRYDPAPDSWAELAPLPEYVADTQIEAAGEGILAAGAEDGPFTWWYDPATDAWESIVSVPATRSNPALGDIDGTLIVAGGETKAWTPSTVTTEPAAEAFAYTYPTVDSLTADLPVSYDVPAVVDLEVQYDIPAAADLEVQYATRGSYLTNLNVAYTVPPNMNAAASLQVQYRTGRTASDRLLVVYDTIPFDADHAAISITITGS